MKNFDLSIVIPFYNEEHSITPLLHAFAKYKKNYSFELICVNNGSTDESSKIFSTYLKRKRYSFIRYIAIKRNIGYGHGILTGVKKSSGDVIVWTHSDMQTPPGDVFRAFELYKKYNSQQIIIKGNRINRPLDQFIFSLGMGILASILLKMRLYEINAQPKLFHKTFKRYLLNAPTDFSLDLYFLYQARKHGYRIKTLNVHFHKRVAGSSKWSYSLSSRIKTIIRTINYIIHLSRLIYA